MNRTFDLGGLSSEELMHLREQIDAALEKQPEPEVVEENKRNRLARLTAYKENETVLRKLEEQKKLDKTDELIGKIKALKPRIDELLVTANACLEAGVEINAYGRSVYRDLDKYECGTFVTNGISHRVGFVENWLRYDKNPHVFMELGIDNGGACGPYDFRTDGENVYSVHEKNTQDRILPSIGDMEAFLREFDKFEGAFYAYLDKVIEKQERKVAQKFGSVSNMIEDATKRAGAPSVSGREHNVELDY